LIHYDIIISCLAQNKRFSSRVIQSHPNIWRFIKCLKQEESVVSHRMVQTGLGFSSIKETQSSRKAKQKTKQVEKLLKLLETKARSLSDTIESFGYLVGELVGYGRKKKKKKKHNVSISDVSGTNSTTLNNQNKKKFSSCKYYYIHFLCHFDIPKKLIIISIKYKHSKNSLKTESSSSSVIITYKSSNFESQGISFCKSLAEIVAESFSVFLKFWTEKNKSAK